jgi:hypothetical protein
MYLAMLLEEEDEVLLETCPVYSEAELATIEAEMAAYITKRDSNDTWKQHKKISASLFRLLDHLKTLNTQYEEIRVKFTDTPFSKDLIQPDYYKYQTRIFNIITLINDFRIQLSKII